MVEIVLQPLVFNALCHLLGNLGVTYMVHIWLVAKRVVDFLLVLIELFFARFNG